MDSQNGGGLEQIQTGGGKIGFFHHMFNLKKGEKSELYNVLQYSVLALLPLIILIRINQNLWPKADEKKGTVELLAEMIGEVALTCLIVFIVFRIMDYIPTFSGEPLKCINLLTIVTTVIISLPWYDKESNIGNKAKELHKRINSNLPSFLSSTLDNQKDEKSKKKKKKVQVHQPSRADKPILPPPRVGSRQDPSPMSGYQMEAVASAPASVGENLENFAPAPPPLLAANEVLGGGFGGSPW